MKNQKHTGLNDFPVPAYVLPDIPIRLIMRTTQEKEGAC